MKDLGYYNGTFGPLDEVQVPMTERVCYFGDGIYEAAYCKNHRIFLLEDHLDRMMNSARLLNIPLKQTKEEVGALLQEMADKVDGDDLTVYWQVSRGNARRSHTFPEQAEPTVWIMVSPTTFKGQDQRWKLTLVDDTRYLHCNIKTLNLIPNVMAAQAAKERGCNEAVFHRGDIVTEGSHTNVHILKDGVLRTHPTDNLILPGVTRKHLLNICGRVGIPVDETPFTTAELLAADEVLITSSTTFCVAADAVDGTPVGGRDPQRLHAIQSTLLEDFKKYSNLG